MARLQSQQVAIGGLHRRPPGGGVGGVTGEVGLPSNCDDCDTMGFSPLFLALLLLPLSAGPSARGRKLR